MLYPVWVLENQFQNKNGSNLVNGKVYVYHQGRSSLANIFQDEDGNFAQSNPVTLDANARGVAYADSSFVYTIVVCDFYNKELFSYDTRIGGAGGTSGSKIVIHDATLSGYGTTYSPLGAVTLPLAVDETMTAYTANVGGKESLVLGVEGDWFNDTFGSAFGDKVDTSAFEECCEEMNNKLSAKADTSALNNYYNKTEINSALGDRVTYEFLNENVYKKYQTSSKEELASAFASAGQGAGDRTPWISGGKEISSMGYLQPGQWFQVLSSFDLSGNKNHFIGVKGGAYNFPTTAMFYDWLDLGQYMPQDYFNNFISGSYNPNINALYNSAGWLMYNKLDISAFSSWSADYGPDQAETYTVTGGNWIDISADDENKVTTISVTGLDGELQNASGTLKNEINDLTNQLTSFSSSTLNSLANKKDKQNELHLSDNGNVVTALHQSVNGDVSADFAPVGESFVPWISGSKVIAPTQTLTSNMIVQILSSFDLSGYKNHNIGMKGGTYRFPNEYEIASGINQTNTFLTQSAFNNYTNVMSDHLSVLYGQDGYLSGRINELSSYAKSVSATVKSNSANWNKVNPEVNNYVTTKSANIDLATSLVIANEEHWSDTYNTVGNTSAKWDDASNKVRSNSAQWAKNDGNTAVNNWVTQNSASIDMVTLGYLTNEANWNGTYYTVMGNSANWSGGGTTFPITSQSGNTRYNLSVSSSALWFTTASGPAGATTRFDVKGITYQAYPATDVSASWYNIIKSSETPSSNCYCVVLNNSKTAANLEDYSAFDRLTIIHGQDYGPDYQLHWDGKTKVIYSGLYLNMAKVKDDQNEVKWTFLNSGWTFDYWWDWD